MLEKVIASAEQVHAGRDDHEQSALSMSDLSAKDSLMGDTSV
ncbi:MAG: hypothetical protein RRA35_10770 [Desulfomonilia bacterium]|nr:hypothetical protein [Desulfomonilia bacterium]